MNTHTEATPACFIPALAQSLIQVQAGVPVFHAISTADCLNRAVVEMLAKAVCNDGMDPNAAFLCRFAIDVSDALRASAGTTA